MPPAPAIERIYQDHARLRSYLDQAGEVSFVIAVEETFPKALLMAIASHFEDQIKTMIAAFCGDCSENHPLVLAFVANKAIERQYHTYFDWDASNANRFFGLFGPDFKAFMQQQVHNDPELDESIRAFIQLGSLRNSLVHINFATFGLNLTASEIYDLYLKGEYFAGVLPGKLRECSEALRHGPAEAQQES